MLRPVILSALAFAILTIARPEKRRRSGDTIITIPLTRRANSTQDYDDMLGYRRLSQGGHNMTYVRRDDKKTEKVITTGHLKLGDYYVSCISQVSFGTPPQPFDLVFDTGSDITWFLAPQSAIPIAKNPNVVVIDTKWGRNAHQVLSIKYTDDSHVSGEYHHGKVNVAGATAEMYFGIAINLQPPSMFPGAGVLGLSFPKKLRVGNWDPIEHSFFWKAMSERRFSSPVFAFYFSSPTDSQVHFGGLSKDHYRGSPEYHSIIDQERLHWELKDAKLYLNHGYTPLLEHLRTSIDTGATNILGHPSQVKQIYDKIGSCETLTDWGVYLYPCEARPVVSFLWRKRRWTVSPDIFERAKMPGHPGMCIGAIQEDKGLKVGEWTLGIAFLRNVYASFHVDERKIAFAKPRKQKVVG